MTQITSSFNTISSLTNYVNGTIGSYAIAGGITGNNIGLLSDCTSSYNMISSFSYSSKAYSYSGGVSAYNRGSSYMINVVSTKNTLLSYSEITESISGGVVGFSIYGSMDNMHSTENSINASCIAASEGAGLVAKINYSGYYINNSISCNNQIASTNNSAGLVSQNFADIFNSSHYNNSFGK